MFKSLKIAVKTKPQKNQGVVTEKNSLCIKLFFLLIITFFACKDTPKEVTISAEPSAITRWTPHKSGQEQSHLDKGKSVLVLGVSSHKEKMTIGGKEYDEPWYLVADVDTINNQTQGWVYGGCLAFPKNYVKPSFASINEKDLLGKGCGIAPCFEGFDENGSPYCGTDCGIGWIKFFNDKEFLSQTYCIESSTSYNLGTYTLSNNILTLTFSRATYDVPDEDGGAEREAPSMIIAKKKVIQKLEVHNFKGKPVFTSLGDGDGDFLGNPSISKPFTNEEMKIIEDLRVENGKYQSLL